jgi:membrane associated rhomboid family serine protease
MDAHYVLSLKNLRQGRYYTLLTSSLTHFDLRHLAMNMMALISVGPPIISLYGAPQFIILWGALQ